MDIVVVVASVSFSLGLLVGVRSGRGRNSTSLDVTELVALIEACGALFADDGLARRSSKAKARNRS